MDESQITGAASSYARKFALGGLFLLDDNKDADAQIKLAKAKAKKKVVETQTEKELVNMKCKRCN